MRVLLPQQEAQLPLDLTSELVIHRLRRRKPGVSAATVAMTQTAQALPRTTSSRAPQKALKALQKPGHGALVSSADLATIQALQFFE